VEEIKTNQTGFSPVLFSRSSAPFFLDPALQTAHRQKVEGSIYYTSGRRRCFQRRRRRGRKMIS